MHPDKVKRETTVSLTDLPNVGPALAKTLRSIGIESPGQLTGRDPLDLYAKLCEKSGRRVDPCVLDVLISVVEFMNGGEAKVWWAYTARRKSMRST